MTQRTSVCSSLAERLLLGRDLADEAGCFGHGFDVLVKLGEFHFVVKDTAGDLAVRASGVGRDEEEDDAHSPLLSTS